jgi:hypothetical protein
MREWITILEACKRMWPTRNENKRAKLYSDILGCNQSLLNRQAEQTTAKREQQADTGNDDDDPCCF